jgi:hypothetical protein
MASENRGSEWVQVSGCLPKVVATQQDQYRRVAFDLSFDNELGSRFQHRSLAVFYYGDFYRRAMIHSMKGKVAAIRTLKQARSYLLQVGVCGIFSDAGVGMPNLWEGVDLPDRQAGGKGWGQKIIAIWRSS